MTDNDDGGGTHLAERLLGLLAAASSWPDDAIEAHLVQALELLPGVDEVVLEPSGAPARGGAFRDFAVGAGASRHGVLSLRVTDARAFAACEAVLPPFCAALAQLLEGRHVSRMAQELHDRALELRHSEKRFRDLFDNSPDPCWLIENGVFSDCNRAAVSILGYSHREDILQHPSRLSPPFQPDGQPSFEKAEGLMRQAMKDGVARFEWEHCRADGSRFPVEVTLARIDLQGHDALYCVWRDITLRKKAQEEAYNLAFFDPLTGLPNRRLLLDRLQQSMAASSRSGKYRALLYLDLDHFKNLNDTQGHDVGDRLLVETARRLNACVREGDTVARLGGDEFVLLLQQLDDDLETAVSQAGMVGGKIVARLAEPCDLGAVVHQGTTSVGIALFVGQSVPVDELLKRADLAMYQAKAGGRNTLRFFDPAIQARITARAAMESELRHAVHRGELVLYYQPQVDPQGRCLGVEALIRWNNPNRGLVPPLEFIPLAEETGLILPIGSWVLGEACRMLRAWQADPLTAHLSIAVNVSARQFRELHFVDEVHAHLAATGIDPSRLKLEITESMLVDNIEQTIATMLALKGMGVTFSLDDFGTGYSSLYYVKRLPLDQIKIDQSFVRDILVDPNDAAIYRAVIALGHSLGLATIAEGVETERQWAVLAGERCDAAQGYLYARPMPAAELLRWLRQRA